MDLRTFPVRIPTHRDGRTDRLWVVDFTFCGDLVGDGVHRGRGGASAVGRAVVDEVLVEACSSYADRAGRLHLRASPVRDREQLIVLVDEWIAWPRQPEREHALGEWADRYFRSHGPATARDFTRWTGLTAADVRTGLALARPRLDRVDVDGVEHLMDPKTPELLDARRRDARGVFLLLGFDELVPGYANRCATLFAEFADRIVPGGNGVFRPTVIDDGRVVGTWKYIGRGAKKSITASPFTAFRTQVTDALPQLYVEYP